jgi:hypothetical protein
VKYWINTVSREHVFIGVQGGFTQADHGRQPRLTRPGKGDLLVFYSPRTALRAGEPLQCFTAIGRITDDAPYKTTVSASFQPWRRRMVFFPSTPAPILLLVPELEFIKDKKRWGFPFRRGLFEISAGDFERIARAMGVEA